MENTETNETTSVEVVIYKCQGKWAVAGLIATIGEMRRNGEDFQPLLDAIAAEVAFASDYLHD